MVCKGFAFAGWLQEGKALLIGEAD